MQILIVIGTSWTGTAAHQASTQVSFWAAGAVLLFLPVAAVVQFNPLARGGLSPDHDW